MLSILTNEDPANLNQIVIGYYKNIILNSITAPVNPNSNVTAYKLGSAGKYFIKGLINDPINSYLVYLFTIDNNINSGTFGVFKMDFNPSTLKYIYTTLSMSSG